MKIKKMQHLYQLTFLPHLFPINCYLFETNAGLIVIDMGVSSFVSTIQKLARDSHQKVAMLLLTHAHGDHVNGVPAFRKAFPHAKVGISRRDSAFLKGNFALQAGEAQRKIKGGFSKQQIQVDFTFTDRELINGLKVVATPGHTPGSVSFLETATKIIVAGDALQTQGGIAVAGVLKLRFPFPGLATWSPAIALASAKKIAQLHPAVLAVGHGEMLLKPEKMLQKAIKAAERKV